MNYGRAVRLVRTVRGLSQKELAESSDLDPNYISMIEAGKRVPSNKALRDIAEALGAPYHLLALLASDAEELRGLPAEHVSALGRQLLDLIIETEVSDRTGK